MLETLFRCWSRSYTSAAHHFGAKAHVHRGKESARSIENKHGKAR
ncbi:hypothetical protein GRAN_3408 [Granulicella sibirica]|uniref:Uncharacterized protein n=1 Tax=Granulicella sibirica TaxID=2479048 RepID=A0A4Q0T4N7_9BACT|nr:hypothetical protein GRAN_3408 [Granulicella sibirica]